MSVISHIIDYLYCSIIVNPKTGAHITVRVYNPSLVTIPVNNEKKLSFFFSTTQLPQVTIYVNSIQQQTSPTNFENSLFLGFFFLHLFFRGKGKKNKK